MTDNDISIEELKEKTQSGNQLQENARENNENENGDGEKTFRDIVEEERNGGGRHLSFASADYAALIRALEEDPDRLEQLANRLADRKENLDPEDITGGTWGDPNRSQLIKSLIWVGLAETDPELIEIVTDLAMSVAKDDIGV